MKVLVTGGAGFIGSHVVERLQDRAHVRVLDNLRTGFRRNLHGRQCDFLEGSILNRDSVRRAVDGVDYVFHLAAMISVPESLQRPIECALVNSYGTLLVLEEAARAKVKKLVFSSSAAIYGDSPVTPKTESLQPDPKSPYALTKLEGEQHCQRFSDDGSLPTACLRYFNVFGPRQDPRSAYAAAVPAFLDRALRDEPITIFGDGRQTRDFVFVRDVAAANDFFATQSPATGVFNVAGGRAITINELAAMICRLTGSRSKINHGPARPGDVRHSVAGIDRLHAAGFTVKTGLLDGLRATVEYSRQMRA